MCIRDSAHAVMHEVGFYFGDLTYNSAYIDVETPAWAKHWFAAIPREKLDGISHLLRFKWVVTNPDTSVWHVFETPDSVSYTHLDVYKRQQSFRPGVSDQYTGARSHSHYYEEHPHTYRSVSYTHL